MVKKSDIDEIFSKSWHANRHESDIGFFRNFDRIKKALFTKVLTQSNNFQTIPIKKIKKNKSNRILFEKIGVVVE